MREGRREREEEKRGNIVRKIIQDRAWYWKMKGRKRGETGRKEA